MRFGINDELKSFPSFQDAAVTILTSFLLYIFMLLPPEGRKDAAWGPSNKVTLYLPPGNIKVSRTTLLLFNLFSLSLSPAHNKAQPHITNPTEEIKGSFCNEKKISMKNVVE